MSATRSRPSRQAVSPASISPLHGASSRATTGMDSTSHITLHGHATLYRTGTEEVYVNAAALGYGDGRVELNLSFRRTDLAGPTAERDDALADAVSLTLKADEIAPLAFALNALLARGTAIGFLPSLASMEAEDRAARLAVHRAYLKTERARTSA